MAGKVTEGAALLLQQRRACNETFIV